jgi:hypothetical protein
MLPRWPDAAILKIVINFEKSGLPDETRKTYTFHVYVTPEVHSASYSRYFLTLRATSASARL